MRLRRRIKKEFNESLSVKTDTKDFLNKSGFHSTKVRKYRNHPRRLAITIPASILASIVLIPAMFLIASGIRTATHNEHMRMSYSLMERRAAEDATFKALNSINYVSKGYSLEPTTEAYAKQINDFSYDVCKEIDFSQDNILFSPLSSYIVNDLFSHAGDEAAKTVFEDALGNENERENNFSKMLNTNFYVSEDASTQLYNGAFFRNDLNIFQSYIDFLSSRKVEAYKASFASDKDKIASWANTRIGEQMIKGKDLETTDETCLILLSLLYFRSKWAIPFVKENTALEDFYLSTGKKTKTNFMSHTIYMATGDKPYRGVYKYDRYLSAYDSYKNDYTIQYLVPLNEKDNIFELLRGVNFFEEDEAAFYSRELFDQQVYSISLHVPKFEYSCSFDVTEALKKTKLGPLFERRANNHVLGNAIDEDFERNNGSGLEKAKQFSSIKFDEDGTVIRSVYFQFAFGATSAVMGDNFTILLNQPFIYVIRDPNGLPLFVGSYVNPL